MADLQGSYDELFAAAPTMLSRMRDDGDAGGSVAVFVDGEPVVDVWGGYADADRAVPWQQDTITNVWSVTKTMTALCALILADRGELDLDARVGRYWPEFTQAGKENVLVRHLLAHTRACPTGTGRLTISTTGRWPPPAWLARRRSGRRAPHPGTTRSPRGSWSARSSGGSPAGAWATSSPRRWPGHSAPTSTSGWPPGTTTGWRSRSPRRARTRTTPPTPPAARPATPPRSGSETVTASPGAGPRSPRPADTATPARWLWCSPCWPAGEWSGAGGCCRRQAVSARGKCSSTAWTASSAGGSAGAWATACSAARSAGAAGAAGAVRSS